MHKTLITMTALAALAVGCTQTPKTCCCKCSGKRAAALDNAAWAQSQWISARDAKVADKATKDKKIAAEGASWFMTERTNEATVKKAVWMTVGLGVYELYVNGKRVGRDALKPGFTSALKTKRSFTYDVTSLLNCEKGANNVFAAEVTGGWWRDQIVRYYGKKSAFRGVLALTYADGTTRCFGTDTTHWRAGVAGPVKRAAIFDGEIYDARVLPPTFAALQQPEVNTEFTGEILPSDGGEICLRCDKALKPIEAYAWKGVTGENKSQKVFGKIVKTRTFDPEGTLVVKPGETVVVDFGQNCAGVPSFVFSAKAGVTLTCLPGEMLNDANGERSRGNDGPGGSLYRENLRMAETGMRLVYTFATSDEVRYLPRHTFFGYRYVSLTATDTVTISCLKSVPVTSITKKMENATLTTGDKDINRFIQNVYWGMLSNYLSVSTDCPQRNERLGWTADTQVFTEAGTFYADTRSFFHKWMRDMRDSQHPQGGFPGVAPTAQYGNDAMRLGWADAGIIVPWTIWQQFNDTQIVRENWAAMERFMARMAETKYQTEKMPECANYQWADWLSLTKFESCPYKPEYSAFEVVNKKRRPKPDALKWWNYLAGCYWLWNAERMAIMAHAIGQDAAKYTAMAAEARAYMKSTFFATADGSILPVFADMQTGLLFALKLKLVDGAAKAKTVATLRKSIADNGGTLHTGFLGTSIALDALTENGMADVAYSLMLNHKFPGWLYSVDQGATTIWERWNSYTKDKGFGPVGMNSFNHYAYGSVMAWFYHTVVGIAATPTSPGFKRIVMRPIPDRRLGHVEASYNSAAGLIKSAWRYEGENWHWTFTVPAGATADVTLPGETASKAYGAGTYEIVRKL